MPSVDPTQNLATWKAKLKKLEQDPEADLWDIHLAKHAVQMYTRLAHKHTNPHMPK